MRKHFLSSFLLLCLFTSTFSQKWANHDKWTELLQKHVDPYGKVDYKGFKQDEAKLDEYLEHLSNTPPQGFWKIDDQKAYWINVYNAYTVKLILKNYPLKSIMDIKEGGNNAWKIPFIQIGKKMYTLDYIEKTMLLSQFNDSRIHFAINCSAKSCPILRNKAYLPENLNIELRLATRRFINDDRFNILSENHLQVSRLFEWYAKDFTGEEGSVQKYLDKYTMHMKIAENASLNYLEYNWALNEK